MFFEETQRFRQWWIWLIIVVSAGSPLIVMASVPAEHGSDYPILIASSVLVVLLFAVIRLDTRLDAAGLHYRFFPVHLKMRDISWDEVEAVYVRTYEPLREYGGWGIRFSVSRKGRAYNVSGNIGLQLRLKSGKPILFGTQKGPKIEQFLEDLVRLGVLDSSQVGDPK